MAGDALSSRQTSVYEKAGRHLPLANSSETGERHPESFCLPRHHLANVIGRWKAQHSYNLMGVPGYGAERKMI